MHDIFVAVGCTSSIAILGRTGPDIPIGLAAPILRVTSSTAIEVMWAEPSRPNGIISGYELRRDGELVYNTRKFHMG